MVRKIITLITPKYWDRGLINTIGLDQTPECGNGSGCTLFANHPASFSEKEGCNSSVFRVGMLRELKCMLMELKVSDIVLNKILFSIKKILIFFLFLHKNIMLWVLIRSISERHFGKYPQHLFKWRNKKNIYLIPTLI